MAAVSSTKTGNWSDPTAWSTGNVPQAADTVTILNTHVITLDCEINAIGATTIAAGGQLTVAFQMSTSTFAGITIAAGGKLYASRSVSSYLRVTGVITVNGPGVALDYGTLADPISNVLVGAYIVFICTSDGQASRGILWNTFDDNIVSFYGATRTMTTTLQNQANIGATTIVLADEIGPRPGTAAQFGMGTADYILVGHTPASTTNGATNDEIDIYRVAGYNAGTRTVTLGDAGAQGTTWARGGTSGGGYSDIHTTARAAGTPVWLISYNVGIRGAAYNLRPGYFFNGQWQANVVTLVNATILYGYRVFTNLLSAKCSNCTFIGAADVIYTSTIYGVLDDCLAVCPTTQMIAALTTPVTLTRCTIIGGNAAVVGARRVLLTGCKLYSLAYGVQNCGNVEVFDSDFRNCGYAIHGSNSGLFKNCTLNGNAYGVIYGMRNLLVDCAFTSNNREMYAASGTVQRNCSSTSPTTEADASTGYTEVWDVMESYDYHATPGDYVAWTKGGVVSRDSSTIFGRSRVWKLVTASISNILLPCYAQVPYTLAPGEVITVTGYSLQQNAGGKMTGVPRLQIIDPQKDPLYSGYEMTRDGSFEIFGAQPLLQWWSFWDHGAQTSVPEYVHGSEGQYAAYITPDNKLGAGIAYGLIPGRQYQISFWARGDGTNGLHYKIVNSLSLPVYYDADTGITGITYQQVTLTFTAPANCTGLIFEFSVAAGFACVDDVSVKQLPIYSPLAEVVSPYPNNLSTWTPFPTLTYQNVGLRPLPIMLRAQTSDTSNNITYFDWTVQRGGGIGRSRLIGGV